MLRTEFQVSVRIYIFKVILLQDQWAQMLEIQYVALPRCPLPSLF